MSPKVSIICPVYNVEAYLGKCVESILSQTFSDFELLLVNDGSSDNSGMICDEYAKRDCRVRVFHKANGGANSARSFGVKKSIGTWVMFVDSDDWLENFALDDLHCHVGNNIGIVVGMIDIHPKMESKILSSNVFLQIQFRGKFMGPVAKLIKRSLFTEQTLVIPPEITNMEDWIMNIRIAHQNKENVVIVDRVIYHYNQIFGSLSKSFRLQIGYWDKVYDQMVLHFSKEDLNTYSSELIHLRLSFVKSELTTKVPYSKSLITEARNAQKLQRIKLSLKEQMILEYPALIQLLYKSKVIVTLFSKRKKK